MLPTALPDSMERSNSTLSLVADQGTDKSNKRHSMIRETVQELQSQQMREQENLSLDQQAWYAGELNVKTASDRLDLLPVGKNSYKSYIFDVFRVENISNLNLVTKGLSIND